MSNYTVKWEISVTADSPRDAACRALEMQRDPESAATYFEVINEDTQVVSHVDLMEESHAKI